MQSTTDVPSPRESALANRYHLGAILGQGGMSTVYSARDLLLSREVAVKVFAGNVMDGSEKDRQGAEVRLLARLSHPNLVTLYDAHLAPLDEAHPEPSYLVTELVDGTALNVRVRSGPLPERQVADLGRQLADCLAYVASVGIIHRDIKPANIILASDGTAKLVDFGIARLIDATRLTSVGLTIGTVAYLSPEQVQGLDLSPATDIYSLGLVLLECLTGRPGYVGTGAEVAMARLARQPTIPPTSSPNLRQLLADMVSREPDARPSASGVARQLAEIATLPASAPATTEPDSDAETELLVNAPTRLIEFQVGVGEGPGRRRVVALAAVAVMLLLTLLLVYLARHGSSGNPALPAATSVPTGAPGPARLPADLNYLRQAGRP